MKLLYDIFQFTSSAKSKSVEYIKKDLDTRRKGRKISFDELVEKEVIGLEVNFETFRKWI